MDLKENVPADSGRDKVDDVIEEEMGHIATLSKMAKVAGSE